MFGVEQFFQTRDAIFVDRSNIVNLGVGAVAMFAACCWLARNLNRFKLDKVHIAALALILFSQASQFWTIAPSAFSTYYARTPLPYYVLYLLIAPILSQDKHAIRHGILATIYIGIPMIVIISFFVEWSGRGIALAKPVIEGGRLTYYTPPLSLADAASYVGLSCIILKPKNSIWKIVYVSTFALACYVVYRTQSRGQLVSLGIVALLFYPIANQASRFKELMLTLGGFAIIGVALYSVFTLLDLGSVNRWTEHNMRLGTEGRIYMVVALLKAWSESGPFYLLFGLGSAAGWQTSGFNVHNLPAEILGELGIVGFSLYLYICIQAFSSAYKVITKLKHYPEMRREAVILIALFAYTCILSLKSVALFSSAPLMFFFAIALSQLERHSRKFSADRLNWRRLLLTSATYAPGRSPQYPSAQ